MLWVVVEASTINIVSRKSTVVFDPDPGGGLISYALNGVDQIGFHNFYYRLPGDISESPIQFLDLIGVKTIAGQPLDPEESSSAILVKYRELNRDL